MLRRNGTIGLAALVVAGLGCLAGEAEARVPARVVRVRYEESGGIAGLRTDLKIYTNRDAVLAGRGEDDTRTLRLTTEEYDSLLRQFSRYRFTEMGPFRTPRFLHVIDGMRYSVTLWTPRIGNPAGTEHEVRSQTGAVEARGYRQIRERLARIARRVAEQGRSGAVTLRASLSARQVGDKVRLEFTLKNVGAEPVDITYRHLNHWAELEAWWGGERVWTWSENKRWPMVMVRPQPLAPGKSLTLTDQFDLMPHWPAHILSTQATFVFKGTSFGPRKTSQRTLRVALPFRGAGASGGAPAGGPGILDGLSGAD